jgi:hypothetical protein
VTQVVTVGSGLTLIGGTLAATAGTGPVLLATLTASNSVSLTDTTHLTATYKSYEIRFINLLQATGSPTPEIYVSVNSGSSYDTTATNYQVSDVAINLVQAASAVAPALMNSTGGLIGGSYPISTTGGGVLGASGSIFLYTPSATGNKNFDYKFTAASQNNIGYNSTNGGGIYSGSTSAINAIKILMSSGNIASGYVEIWGNP